MTASMSTLGPGGSVAVGRGHRVFRAVLGTLLQVAALVAAYLWAWPLAARPMLDAVDPDRFTLRWTGVCLAVTAGFVLGRYLLSVLHELGHLGAARLLRLPVLGVAFGRFVFGQTERIPGAGGHVRVDLRQADLRSLPARMVVFALAGPVAALVAAAVAALLSGQTGLPIWVRLAFGGVAAQGAAGVVLNLVPGYLRGGTPNDGSQALGWMFRPGWRRGQLQLARDLRTYGLSTTGGTGPELDATAAVETPDAEFDRLLRTALADPRPPVVSQAMRRLLSWFVAPANDSEVATEDRGAELAARARRFVPLMSWFMTRPDQPAAQRATLGSAAAKMLSLSYLHERRGMPTDPASPQVVQLADLAEAAYRLQPESLPVRNTLGLVRLIQDRPAETRTLLAHAGMTTSAEPAEVAEALAIRGRAEIELGDLVQAERLAASARRMAPDGAFQGWLDEAIRQHRDQVPTAATQAQVQDSGSPP